MSDNKILKPKIINRILNIYIFIFVFNMMNREFTPFGFDIRYLLIILSIPLLVYKIKDKNNIIKKINLLDKIILLYAFLCIFSNIGWVFNGLNIGADFISYNILFGFNILTICIVILYKEKMDLKTVVKSIFISGLVLFVSILAVSSGIGLKSIFGGDYPGIVKGIEHINFFGKEFRAAGYAEDANYASMFMVILFATTVYFVKNNKIFRNIFLGISIIGFMLSASKTVFIGVIAGAIAINMFRSDNWKINRLYSILKNVFLVGIIIGPYVLMRVVSNPSMGLPTMDNRFLMWNRAIKLFEESPIFGNGLTSFRAYFESSGGWYVQCHSTIFQILSEVGIIALILFAIIFYFILKYRNSYTIFLTFVFLVFCITTELNHLSLMAFMMSIIPLVGREYKEDKKIDDNRVLYLINSLGTGGAERVVANSANKMAEKGKDVTIITLKNQMNYEFNENVKIITLNENNDLSKIQKLLRIPLNIIRINTIICKLEKDCRFALITSHLPITHIISRFLIIKDRILFVIHNPHHHMDPNNSIIFKLMLRVQYGGCKVITVSKGVEDELTIKYGVKCEKIKTIYNPIDIDKILKSKDEEFEIDYKYMLFCGRLTPQKRPDILIKAFYEGNFKEKYKLVLLGEGELKEDLLNQCKELNLGDSVIFAGWQNNVYKWMKKCEVMISTSDYEAFPMNLLEAFACSAKVVSMDCDFGPREILIDEFKNYLVPLNNISKLVDTIKEALEYYPDSMFDKIKRFDCENINSEYLETSLSWIE